MQRRTFLAAGTAATLLMRSATSHSARLPDAGHAMQMRKIPSSGELLPVIGMGTWQTFDIGADPKEQDALRAVLREFAHSECRLVDSSPMYGRSEEVLGELCAQLALRPRLFIATKVWTTGREQGIRQMQDSMRKLRIEQLDLMQVHNLVDVRTHLDTLAAWKRDGRVRYVGITHYTASAQGEVTRLLETVPLDFVQINYSVREREAERRLLEVARERGVAVIANRPFAGGAQLARLSRRALPEFAQELGCSSWAQLLLKFVVSHPAITAAIPATSKLEHLRDNLQAGHGVMPDAALRERIAAAAA